MKAMKTKPAATKKAPAAMKKVPPAMKAAPVKSVTIAELMTANLKSVLNQPTRANAPSAPSIASLASTIPPPGSFKSHQAIQAWALAKKAGENPTKPAGASQWTADQIKSMDA
jgi:hypothetical protein